MFEYLAYNGGSEVATAEAQKLEPESFCPQQELTNSFSAAGKIQLIAKEMEVRDHKLELTSEMKPHSTPATLLWLAKNYELAEGICIPRNALYSHYIHFCKTNSMSPLNSASFGKIIRQAFPSLTTRRLGTRGQSRYHYYGIAIKQTSPYYDIGFSKMSFGCSEGKKIIEKNGSSISLARSRETLKLWPQFPNMKNISFPPHVSQEKLTSFIIMYHTHCQRIFDIIVRGTLDDACQFFEHFWQGVPSHLSDLLDTNTVVNMVGVCDSILYRTINNVLMPNVLKCSSESLIYMIRNFAEKLENWISSALCDVPPNLKSVKLKLGKRFCSTLRRQIALYQLTHTAQVVFSNSEMMAHINKDWKKIHLGPIVKQALMFAEFSEDHLEAINYIKEYWENFQELVERQATIEDCTERLEHLVRRCVVDVAKKNQVPLRKVARPFLLLWHVMESLISRDMTIHSAASFGSFHLIQTMFDEYAHYLVEMLYSEEITKYLLKNVSLDVLPDFDSSWNGFNESSDIFQSNPNLNTLTNLPGNELDVTQTDFQGNSVSFYSVGPDMNFSKVNIPQSDPDFINNLCQYQNNGKHVVEEKYKYSNSFSDNVALSDFTSECVEFSAGIYCQEDLQYNSAHLQYQNGSFTETNHFQILE